MARLTLHDFYRTGQQDAANVFDKSDVRDALHDHPGYTDAQLLADILDQTYDVNAPATKTRWIADQDDFEGLDPERAWASYQRGWADQALAYIKDWRPAIEREHLESNPRRKGTKPMSRRNPDNFDDDIKNGMARAIWVTSFADWVGELPKAQQRELAPGGGDWNDAAGETPRSALEAGQALIELYEQANDKPIADLFRTAAQADGRKPSSRLADLFGHALAMQALGTGVAWTDDHKSFPLKRIHFQAWLDASPDDDRDAWRVDWSPRSMANPAAPTGTISFREIRAGDTFQKVDLAGGGLGPIRKAVGAPQQARAKGYWLVEISGGQTVSFQQGDQVKVRSSKGGR